MSFWGFIGILLLLAIMASALLVAKYAAQKEAEFRELKFKARQTHLTIVDLDEICRTLLLYDKDIQLLDYFIKEMRSLIDRALELMPDSESIRGDVLNVRSLEQEVDVLRNSTSEPEIPVSDQQINLMKKHFLRAQKAIKRLAGAGRMPSNRASEQYNRLVQSALLLEVKAYRKQGNIAKNEGDTSSAANFFKHAKELLMKSELNFEGKSELIKKTSNDLSGLYVTNEDEENDDETEATSEAEEVEVKEDSQQAG
ncbi:hypothetical protein [Reinekea thalattae]|uniref:DNA topoisomerase I n=1 Tax=Reinekea thalattae TaxID=2593301 RepID=A0A5C8Z639_9GAMM|nr:hypothetical protein [Reinekea thalattae]TXR53432.1 hypothetical protein FME95_02355 [Reinekea thalattae]